MLKTNLKSKVDELWDMFWANGMPEHIEALEHISYLVFMKKLEDYENDRIKGDKKLGKKYQTIFEGNETMRWSVWKNYEGGKMLEHVKTKVFPFIKNLGEKESTLQLELSDANFEMKSSVLLEEAIQIIEDLKISEQNQDIQGDIFEYMMSKLETAGLNGQFRTPRHIIKMMVELIDPDVKQTICDPACGTSGFLVNAYQHIKRKYTSKELLEYDDEGNIQNPRGDLLGKNRNFLMNDQLFGFDFSNTMIRIGIMNMILHGFTKPNVHYDNSLGKEFDQSEEFQIILANPPFSGKLNKNEINKKLDSNTTKTELLFVELIYNKLLVGGQAAIIVPSGVLFGSSKAHKYIRKILLEKCQLEAIIYLPQGVFKPYSSVATAVLILTKGGSTDKIWLYEMKNDGLSLDDKRIDIDENDIPDVIEKFPKRIQSEKSLTITIEDIKENDNKDGDYNLNVRLYIDNYKPEKETDIQTVYEKIKKLKKEREKLEKHITNDLRDLKFKV